MLVIKFVSFIDCWRSDVIILTIDRRLWMKQSHNNSIISCPNLNLVPLIERLKTVASLYLLFYWNWWVFLNRKILFLNCECYTRFILNEILQHGLSRKLTQNKKRLNFRSLNYSSIKVLKCITSSVSNINVI